MLLSQLADPMPPITRRPPGRCPLLRLLLLAVLLVVPALGTFAPDAAGAGQLVNGPKMTPGSGVDIEIAGFYSTVPSHGFAPFRVTIDNQSGRERTWSFQFVSQRDYSGESTVTHEASFTVESGQARQFDVMVPLVRSTYNDGQLFIQVNGYGVAQQQLHVFYGYRRGMGTRSISLAMSEKLGTANWNEIESQLGSSSYAGSPFSTAHMPSDWRAYVAFDQLYISDDEWRGASTPQRLAVLDWIATGGELFVCREPADIASALPDLPALTPDDPVARGFGQIHLESREKMSLNRDAIIRRIQHPKRDLLFESLENGYRASGWGLLNKLADVRLRPAFFITFLILFGIVIGPVNLFLFARGSKRHRLFWTTPLLSIGASLFIFVLILVQDGVGGIGHQVAIWTHFPDENRSAFLQEQASRTSLLPGRGFSVDTPVFLSLMEIDSPTSFQAGRFQAGGRSFDGDWFRSRSRQGHLIQGVTATRWRLEASGDAGSGLQLLSTFPFTLKQVFIHDANGRWWRAENVESGQIATFTSCEEKAFQDALSAFLKETGPILSDRVRNAPDAPGRFYAFAEGKEGTVPTFERIDWLTQKHFHTGPIAATRPSP